MSLIDTPEALRVFDGIDLQGAVNTADDVILDQVRHSIRLGHPQVQMQPIKPDRIALVGSGPSLASTERELVELVHAGAKLVTVNGAYAWCLERNLKPSAQIVLDARPSTARFLSPEVPGCRYYLASQCHAAAWAAVERYAFVGIWHAALNEVADESERPIVTMLNAYYRGQWQGVAGGTTVTTRAIGLLRMLGYLRFDLFGFDSCWIGDQHHAFPQVENQRDQRLRLTVSPVDRPEAARVFECAPWMAKQAEDAINWIKFNGDKFLLHVHGDGLIAYLLQSAADLQISVSA